MNAKKKIILGLVGIFLFFGVLSSLVSPSSHSNVKSAATSHDVQLTISPVNSSQTSLPPITVKPTETPIPKPTITPLPTPTPTTYVAPTQAYVPPATNQSSGLSNDNYYTNVNGNQVHSPAYSTNNSVPAGATALCSDGTYSFSQHRSGTCSHHGGVASWL